MKNKRGIWILGLIIISFIAALYFDSYIIEGVTYLKNGFLDEFLIGLTFTSTEVVVFFLLTGLFLWNENKRKWILPLWFTLLLSSVASFILKVAVQRLRPFQQGIIDISSFLVKHSYYAWDFSFPSAQAMLVFCSFPVKGISKIKILLGFPCMPCRIFKDIFWISFFEWCYCRGIYRIFVWSPHHKSRERKHVLGKNLW